MDALWYTKAAERWEEALPIGNGRLGAMVFGGAGHETIQLNEESVWSGAFRDRNNSSARTSLPEIRRLMKAGRILEAQELAYQCLSGTPSQQAVYQTAGELHIDFKSEGRTGLSGPTPATEPPFGRCLDYRRELNLRTAVARVSFRCNGSAAKRPEGGEGSMPCTTYLREALASAAGDIIIIHIASSRPHGVYFRANLERGDFATRTGSASGDSIFLEDTHGIPFAAAALAVARGGTSSSRGGCLIVEAADEADIYLDIQSAFRQPRYARTKGRCRTKADTLAARCRRKALARIRSAAKAASYPAHKTRHLAEYTPWYEAASLRLHPTQENAAKQPGPSDQELPTDRLLAERPESNALAELYWNYCRYLLISCSRAPGTLPATLQGLWNKDFIPPWGSKFTININTQMNYWPAAMCSMAQTEAPLFSLLARAYKNGRRTARAMYGCSGYLLHHNTDIWGDSAPQDKWIPGSYWTLGAAWLATHIREHYEYTLDKTFLRKHFRLMREACRFFADYLSEDEDGGHLIVSPSVSPENSYRQANGDCVSFSAGCDMDNRILEHLFRSTLDSARDLGLLRHGGSRLLRRIQDALGRIEPPAITEEGTIREWPSAWQEAEPGHRHISQLYGLFPGHSMDLLRTPGLARAAHNTIEKRLAHGGGHTGWSQAWILNFRASLHEAEEARCSLVALLERSTLPNLFDNHPPFQIDGNFGALAGVTRMLVQSEYNGGRTLCRLLPALPEEWGEGSLTGISLKGNLAADLAWKDGSLFRARIYAKGGRPHAERLCIYYRGKSYEAQLGAAPLNAMEIIG